MTSTHLEQRVSKAVTHSINVWVNTVKVWHSHIGKYTLALAVDTLSVLYTLATRVVEVGIAEELFSHIV